MGRPLWRATQAHVRSWRQLGCSEYLCRMITYGIYEHPSIPFTGEGTVIPTVTQTAEDIAFANADLLKGCNEGIYLEITPENAERARRNGSIISSAFTVWQEGIEGCKGSFVINLSTQSTHWRNGSIRMEGLAEFACNLQHGDFLLSMDIKSG